LHGRFHSTGVGESSRGEGRVREPGADLLGHGLDPVAERGPGGAEPGLALLADFTVYVIDVAGGDKIPRKGGPGITQSDLLVVNKTDLAPAVGADLSVMARDAARMRGDGPVVFAQVARGGAVDQIAGHILHALQHATGQPH